MSRIIPVLACSIVVLQAFADATDTNGIDAVLGNDWKVPSIGLQFRWIEKMQMWVGKHEVTNHDLRLFRHDHDSGDYEGYSLDQDAQPVVNVSAFEAVAYAEWLTRKYGINLPSRYLFRLPTEKEWEQFASCGENWIYPWGNKWPPPNDWNYHGQEGVFGWDKIERHDDGHPVTCPVSQSGVNAWGLYGVGGNALEWCENGAQDPALRLKRPYVARGGSWIHYREEALRLSFRRYYDEAIADKLCHVGFRLVIANAPRSSIRSLDEGRGLHPEDRRFERTVTLPNQYKH